MGTKGFFGGEGHFPRIEVPTMARAKKVAFREKQVYTYIYIGYVYTFTYSYMYVHMRGCQNYGPVLGPLNTRCRIILRNKKGTIILIASQMYIHICICTYIIYTYIMYVHIYYVYLCIHIHIYIYIHIHSHSTAPQV